ncbi:flagellin [Methylobacterium sp. ap11]|uniref:flagellin N-terminal helical domain-containing protein n=1 Tax=Methylobacterium sp. ap11 TaxID=1761799 RepID=UPI0015A61F5C|nr:flagellin [Methylobacterium sp. ap11]
MTIQQTVADATIAQNRLATGKKVNSALDNPLNFFAAAGLDQRASDLSGLQDNMQQAVRTLTAASSGIDGMTKLFQTAQGLANSAAAESDPTRRNTLTTQFNTVLSQVDELMKNSGYGGTNLLNGDKLSVSFDAKSTTSTLSIQTNAGSMGTGALTSNNLGVATAAAGAWTNATTVAGGTSATSNTVGDAAIAAKLTQLSTAIGTLRTEASGLGSTQAIVAARQAFTTSMVNTLKSGSGSLNTRGQLAQTALSLATQRDQQVLQLLR